MKPEQCSSLQKWGNTMFILWVVLEAAAASSAVTALMALSAEKKLRKDLQSLRERDA